VTFFFLFFFCCSGDWNSGTHGCEVRTLPLENGKMRPFKTIPGKRGEEGIKEKDGVSEFNYDIV
jgi:hypothetical protein